MAFSDWLSSAKKLGRLAFGQSPVREKILSVPYYRLQSLAQVREAAQLGLKIDVNRASVDDWLRLPGISIHQARSLVELVGMGVQLLCIEDVAAVLNLPLQQLQPLEPILYFCYYDPESLSTPQRINPNTASVEQLAQIPAIGTALATEIVRDRQQQGAYRNLADLGRRLSLDTQTTSQLLHYLQF